MFNIKQWARDMRRRTRTNDKYAEINRKARAYWIGDGRMTEGDMRRESARRHENAMLPQDFRMADSEYAAATIWMNEHGTKHLSSCGTVPGQYWIRFYRHSIGEITTIGCSMCGDERDVTDNNLW